MLKSSPGRLFKWCKGETTTALGCLARSDGTMTGNVDEMDGLLHDAWMPIFQLYREVAEPAWDAFAERYGSYFKQAPMQVTAISGEELASLLSRMSGSSSRGAEGWGVEELKRLALPVLDDLAELLNTVEATGVWPQALREGLVSLISKGEGASPNQLRPITVMSAIYRLWAVRWLQDLKLWQEKWAHKGQHGYRQGHSTLDVCWALALKVEAALLSGKPVFGICFDFAKCFDRIPHNILLELVERMGLAPRVLRPIRTMYRGLQRRFRVGAYVGSAFQSTNGILQGCPLSVILLNALVCV